MSHDDLVILGRVAGALLIGGLIGIERSFHGRPAGFRTHSLVCIASTLLMIITVYQDDWMTHVAHDAIRTDPTRMAQGIMTGIGFLGAGVIFKEDLTVRGLTTAASIWVTSALGILVGVGFYYLAVVGTVATLVILSLFRFVERKLPSQYFCHHMLRFARDNAMGEEALRAMLVGHGFSIDNLASGATDGGRMFEYRMTLRSQDPRSAENLSRHLRETPQVIEFSIAPTGG
ncbi:MAG: MgtC/SapB family protein [Rhodospirillales bacterium]|nr:MgtC/SapB family protein [Rhodospirillales bacterium]